MCCGGKEIFNKVFFSCFHSFNAFSTSALRAIGIDWQAFYITRVGNRNDDIFFFDEIDALIPTRSAGASDSHVAERVLSQFLSELDGVEELKGVLVLGATNRPDMIDPAILRPGRFDAVLEILLPDRPERRAIFEVHLRNKPLAAAADLDELASQTDGFSGADIEAVCRRAAMEAVRRVVESMQDHPLDPKTLGIEPQDIHLALDEVQKRRP